MIIMTATITLIILTTHIFMIKKCDGAEKLRTMMFYEIVTETICKEASVGVAMIGKVNNHEKLEHFENYSMGKYLPRKHLKNHLKKLPAETAYRKSLLEAEIYPIKSNGS